MTLASITASTAATTPFIYIASENELSENEYKVS